MSVPDLNRFRGLRPGCTWFIYLRCLPQDGALPFPPGPASCRVFRSLERHPALRLEPCGHASIVVDFPRLTLRPASQGAQSEHPARQQSQRRRLWYVLRDRPRDLRRVASELPARSQSDREVDCIAD
jgi:hypothetical protein